MGVVIVQNWRMIDISLYIFFIGFVDTVVHLRVASVRGKYANNTKIPL